jgi:S-layer protein (TIGR01567 family)
MLNGGKGETANSSWIWNSTNFPDFVLNENLKGNIDIAGRIIPKESLWYNTSRVIVKYQVNESTGEEVDQGLDINGSWDNIWPYKGGYYAKIGLIGQSYVAVGGHVDRLSKLVLEQNATESKILTVGETWNLGDGYSLKLDSIDRKSVPRQAFLVFNNKSGFIDERILNDNNSRAYTYVNIFYNAPFFVTYVDSISTNSVQLKYSWLISDNILKISPGDQFDNMKIWNPYFSNWNQYLNLTNDNESINLSSDSSFKIMGDLYFKILNSTNLSYYPYFGRPKRANTIDILNNNLSMEISVNDSIPMKVNVTEMSDIPPGMSQNILGLKSMNRFIDIDVNDNVRDHLEFVKIKFYYTQAELDANGLKESDLKILWYNETSPKWEQIPQQGYDPTDVGMYTGHVWANLSHLSTFALAGKAATSTPCTNCNGGSGGSGGGGGGGGSSGENFNNIEVIEKYDMQISKDALTSYRFTHAKNPIMYVNITGNTSLGIITASMEVLKNTSTLVKIAPEGLVYKNANIWVGTSGYATPKNIKEALIKFKIDNTWMSANGVSSSDIVLMKWDGKGWISLKTTVVSKDDTNSYFEGWTNAFSPFAIVAKTSPVAKPIVTTTPVETPKINATGAPQPTKKAPGFGIVLALVGLMAIVLRRRGW